MELFFVKRSNDINAIEVTRGQYDSDFSNYIYSLFVTSEWMESMAEKSNLVYLNLVRNGVVVGKASGLILPGTRYTGKYLFMYAGPAIISNNKDLYFECIASLWDYARKKRLSKININYYDQQNEWVYSRDGFYKRGLFEYVKYFDLSEQAPKFGKSVMYNVRKATKTGATFHIENSERVLAKLHELLELTQKIRFEKYGADYKSYPYFFMTKEKVDELFYSGILKLFHVEVDGEIHCVRCALDKDKRMYGLMIASDEFTYKNGIQHFLQYHLINKLHEEGYKYYNIAGTAAGEEGKGLSEYKESLGCSRRLAYGTYTHFITFPHNLINPLMSSAKILSRNRYMDRVVKFGSKVISGNISW
ncbi:MAG: GNAT family N-acetyltransferase [Breznakibacter sp.]